MLEKIKTRDISIVIGLIALVLLAALPVLTYPMGRDQGMYANIGRTILNGGVPYVDMWDQKPPPIYYLYASAIAAFGVNTVAIRVLDFVLVPVGMLGLWLFGSAIQGRKLGLMAALFFGAFYFNDGFQNLSQSDSLATVPMIFSAYTALRATQINPDTRNAWLWALASGALAGILLWFKHYYALVVLAFALYHVFAHHKQIAQTWRTVVAFCIGGLVTGGGLLIYFWQLGVLDEILVVAQSTASYNAQGYDDYWANMLLGFQFRWAVWHGLLILAMLWIPVKFFNKNMQPEWVLVILWLIGGTGFALIQGKGFDTHWFAMLPPLALLAADTVRILIDTLSTRLGNKKVIVTLYGLCTIAVVAIPALTTWRLALPYFTGQETRIAYFDKFQANDLKAEQSLQVAEYLRERTVPNDTLYVWGFRPEVTFMAGLRPATRYQVHFPLVAPWYPQEWQQDNVDILWAALPPYVLVLEDDYMEWVTNTPDDSHTILQNYTELNNWLIFNYERQDKIGDFIVWERKQQS